MTGPDSVADVLDVERSRVAGLVDYLRSDVEACRDLVGESYARRVLSRYLLELAALAAVVRGGGGVPELSRALSEIPVEKAW